MKLQWSSTLCLLPSRSIWKSSRNYREADLEGMTNESSIALCSRSHYYSAWFSIEFRVRVILHRTTNLTVEQQNKCDAYLVKNNSRIDLTIERHNKLDIRSRHRPVSLALSDKEHYSPVLHKIDRQRMMTATYSSITQWLGPNIRKTRNLNLSTAFRDPRTVTGNQVFPFLTPSRL